MGFEPTRAEPNGLAVHRLNHSATSSCTAIAVKFFLLYANRSTNIWNQNARVIEQSANHYTKNTLSRKRIRTHACRDQWDKTIHPFTTGPSGLVLYSKTRIERFSCTIFAWDCGGKRHGYIITEPLMICNGPLKPGSTEIWTRIAGFRVQSANHYTIEP